MPFLKSISVENFRGFFAQQAVIMAQPNGKVGSGLTILVGPNNAGKTTILNALRLVLSPRHVDLEQRHEGKVLKISIESDAGESKSVSNPDLGATLVFAGDASKWPKLEDFRSVPSRRSWAPYVGQQKLPRGDYWNTTATREPRDGDDPYFVSRVADFSVEDRLKFGDLLKELLPQLNTWRIEISRGQTFIQYETKSGARHAADLFGDGMASLFRVALTLFDSMPGQIVAIDEPELSLHPQAQKLVANVLARFASDRQVLIATHSPYLVNWADIVAGAKVLRLSQSEDGIVIGKLADDTVSDIERLIDDWQKPNLLDAVAREVFFADEVLFLEGQEDVGLLRKFALEKGMRALPAFGYGAGGAGNIPLFLRMARDLKIPAAAIFDGDHPDEKAAAEMQFPDCLVELLGAPDIRDKPKRNEKGKETEEIGKEGVFDRRGRIKEKYEAGFLALLNRISNFFVRGGKKRPRVAPR
ncbi:MAG: AAA family ATPase [Proteobacteria bacterium]|nr:AAA family ATPase [Pseudomonadota bacterium]